MTAFVSRERSLWVVSRRSRARRAGFAANNDQILSPQPDPSTRRRRPAVAARRRCRIRRTPRRFALHCGRWSIMLANVGPSRCACRAILQLCATMAANLDARETKHRLAMLARVLLLRKSYWIKGWRLVG